MGQDALNCRDVERVDKKRQFVWSSTPSGSVIPIRVTLKQFSDFQFSSVQFSSSCPGPFSVISVGHRLTVATWVNDPSDPVTVHFNKVVCDFGRLNQFSWTNFLKLSEWISVCWDSWVNDSLAHSSKRVDWVSWLSFGWNAVQFSSAGLSSVQLIQFSWFSSVLFSWIEFNLKSRKLSEWFSVCCEPSWVNDSLAHS